MGKPRFNSRELTNRLRELLAEVHDTVLNDDKEAVLITKGEALAELLMTRALGWTEEVIEESGIPGKTITRKVLHNPERWAIELIYDRTEGKSPQALPDDKGGLTAADRVSEIAKKKVNQLTEEATAGESDGT